MKIESTTDVSLSALHQFRDELGPDIEVVVEKNQIVLLSAESPSWVTFFAEVDWWVKLLAAYVGLYIAEIIREAAKEHWRNRSKGFAAIHTAGDLIKKLALGLYNLRRRLSTRTKLIVGLPGPNEHFGTRLTLSGSDADEIAAEIALFVYYLPALQDLIRAERLDQGKVAVSLSLDILPDGSLAVWWQDKETHAGQRRVLPLKGAV